VSGASVSLWGRSASLETGHRRPIGQNRFVSVTGISVSDVKGREYTPTMSPLEAADLI
jgi:hypothetical protein